MWACVSCILRAYGIKFSFSCILKCFPSEISNQVLSNYFTIYNKAHYSTNRVAPVGHRRCFLLESGPLERPEFRFLHAGFKSAEEFLKQKVTPKFGEDVTIAEVNGSADYSRELECLRRDSQPRRPSRWHSSSYRVVDNWRDTICEYFYEHLRCEIHSHRVLPGERAIRSIINMLRKELASEKDFHWLEVLFALLRRYHNTPLYHGLSPNEIVFGRKKCWWNMPLNNPRPCKDASLFLDEIQRAEKTDWLWVQNQGRKNPHNFEVDDRV